MTPQQQPFNQDQRSGRTARDVGDLVTKLTKLAGAAVAINETLIRTELRPIALAVAALMLAGAQGLESVLDRLLGK